ncbi:MAG: NAD(P)H dehydrogenase assembly family protein, partial [Cyanobacteria bacterium J06636_16]
MSFLVGDRVRLKSQPPYFKTADPMPMLRPPDLISVGDVGIVT